MSTCDQVIPCYQVLGPCPYCNPIFQRNDWLTEKLEESYERGVKFMHQRDILAAAIRRLRNIHPLVLKDAQALTAAVDLETERALREAGMDDNSPASTVVDGKGEA